MRGREREKKEKEKRKKGFEVYEQTEERKAQAIGKIKKKLPSLSQISKWVQYLDLVLPLSTPFFKKN